MKAYSLKYCQYKENKISTKVLFTNRTGKTLL